MHILPVFFLSLSLLYPNGATATEKTPDLVVVREIEKNILPLPACNDEKLMEKTKQYIKEYFSQTKSSSMKFRRRRYFLQNRLAEFQEENIANYKTEQKRPISDIIITLKMNDGIIEENMRLCKNQSRYPEAKDLYILYHPAAKGWKIYVINLKQASDIPDPTENISFIYE